MIRFERGAALTAETYEDIQWQTTRPGAFFIVGLRSAHAMENQALSIMKPQLGRIENYPEVAKKLDQHIIETQGQIRRIEEILAGLDEDHSTLKDMALSFTGSMAALGHGRG
jgi:ferritin-like metal-binding protein YciE